MKLYIVELDGGGEGFPRYEGTVNEAKTWVKGTQPKAVYTAITVTEIDVQTNKAGIVALLNDEAEFTRGRVWGITPRGGLKEEMK